MRLDLAQVQFVTRCISSFIRSSILAMACLSGAGRKCISQFTSPAAALRSMRISILSETSVATTQTEFKTVDSEVQTDNRNILQCAFDSITLEDKVIVTTPKPFHRKCKSNFCS